MGEPRPVVLVTGAAGHLGSALLRHFACSGYRTAGTDLHAGPPAGAASAAHLWRRADVTVAEDMHGVVDDVLDAFGRLDMLVVNAGVTALGSFDDTDDDAFVRVMDVNVHGAVRVTRAALPALRASRGRIVVMSSVAGFAPVVGRPAYCASKHAVTGLFESIRPELASAGVSLTMVYPSFLRTSPTDLNAQPGTGDTGHRATTGRLLDADLVARMIVAGVRRGRRVIRPGGVASAAHLLHRLSPGLYRRVMRRRLSRVPH